MRALLSVGVKHYEDGAIADLEFADRDAAAFAAAGLEKFGIAPQLSVVLNGWAGQSGKSLPPTRPRILKAISEIIEYSRRTPLELFFFFFSGHGLHVSNFGHDFLLTADTVGQMVEETGLSFLHLETLLRQLNCRYRVLFIDACRARVRAVKGEGSEERLDVRRLCPDGMVTFCSCYPKHASYEAKELKHGIFTYVLLKGFSADGNCTSVVELDRYLESEMPKICSRAGLPEQRPYTRVEPLHLRDLVLVSDLYQNTKQSKVRIGKELRKGMDCRFTGRGSLPDNLIAAIDFGTSYSAMAVCCTDGTPLLIPTPDGHTVMPSAVRLNAARDYVVGWPAHHGQGGVLIEQMKRAIVENKSYDIGGDRIDPILVSSLLLRSMRRNAEEFLERPVSSCIIGMPADFGISLRKRIYKAFELAGFNVTRDVIEPSAVALLTLNPHVSDALCGMGRTDNTDILVLDLGGGTFDVALIRKAAFGELSDVVEIVGGLGDEKLGGVDFDLVIADILTDKLRQTANDGGIDSVDLGSAILMQKAEEIKRSMSVVEAVNVIICDLPCLAGNIHDMFISINRDECRNALKPLIERFSKLLDAACKFTWNESGMPDAVVLGGQGSKIHWIRRVVYEKFSGIPIIDQYQENAVVLGLARQVAIMCAQGPGSLGLLLEMFYWGIAVMTQNSPENEQIVSAVKSKNDTAYPLFEPGVIIPTRKIAYVRIVWEQRQSVILHFRSISPQRRFQHLADIEIGRSWLGDEDWLQIVIDIGTDRAVAIHIFGGFIEFDKYFPPSVEKDAFDPLDPKVGAVFLVEGWRKSMSYNRRGILGELRDPLLVRLPVGFPRSNDLTLIWGTEGNYVLVEDRSSNVSQ